MEDLSVRSHVFLETHGVAQDQRASLQRSEIRQACAWYKSKSLAAQHSLPLSNLSLKGVKPALENLCHRKHLDAPFPPGWINSIYMSLIL